jgi:hypothetical protein
MISLIMPRELPHIVIFVGWVLQRTEHALSSMGVDFDSLSRPGIRAGESVPVAESRMPYA